MQTVDDWAEIRRLFFTEKLGVKTIARRLGIARNTVTSAVRSLDPPKYVRPRPPSLLDDVEPRILELLREFPTMPATVIAERIGWAHGMTILRRRVAELRPLFTPPDPCQRTTYRPGELAHFDLWQPATSIPVGFGEELHLWVVTCVSGFSRFRAAWMVPTRAAHDVCSGMLRCYEQLGALPKTAVWDNEGCIGQWRQGRQSLTDEFQRFRGALGIGVRLCRPRDPEAKGMNERTNGYLETSFLPGRSFEDAHDFNGQLQRWLVRANGRVHGTTRKVPATELFDDRGSMRALPQVLPDPAARFSVRLPRDHYVRFDTNDYSVDPRAIGRRVEVRVDLQELTVTCGGTEVARHRRFYGKHRSLLHPRHAVALRCRRSSPFVASRTP
jgi:transposase